MNAGGPDGLALIGDIVAIVAEQRVNAELLVCPPALVLSRIAQLTSGTAISVGGQDCHAEPSGAHTGDISAEMLAAAGASHVIVGHSERRTDHEEDDRQVKDKAAAAHRAGLVAIICVGETEEQHDNGQTLDILSGQLSGSIPESANAKNTVIAYEPVWAIGTGRTPGQEEIREAHGHIRQAVRDRIANGDQARLLYGGSVKPDNAAQILAVPDINGALIGGASLNAADFIKIARAAG